MVVRDIGSRLLCMSFSLPMPPHLSGHLPNVALLALSVGIALAADRLATSPVDAPGASNAGAQVAPFMTPVSPAATPSRSVIALPADPFGRTGTLDEHATVAPVAPPGTVSSTSRAARLTAILIADERRIAVIDETTVKVGDTLRDGARVASIQADRVWLSDRNGRMRMLTLSTGVR
jgi:hypothetical protein